MPLELLPSSLNRKQYLLRWLVWLGFVGCGFFLFVAALIRSEVYLGWLALAWLYEIFGLAIPRLRNAKQSPWLAILLFVPAINIAMLVFLFVVPSKDG